MSNDFVTASASIDAINASLAGVAADITEIKQELADAVAKEGGMTQTEADTIVSKLADVAASVSSLDAENPAP